MRHSREQKRTVPRAARLGLTVKRVPHASQVKVTATAVLRSGGSLGTALLNTLYAGAVTSFLAEKLGPNADKAQAAKIASDSLVHGYHVAFFWGSVLLTVALLMAVLLINAKKDDIPQEAGVPAAA